MGFRARNWGTLWLLVLLALAPMMRPLSADTCSRTDFESAVDEASAALRELNSQNRPRFQQRLRELKDKRGWTLDQFQKEALPFVSDAHILALDEKSKEQLAKIEELGAEGGQARTPDCNLLVELRTHMKVLVEAQQDKWAYMFQKLETELKK